MDFYVMTLFPDMVIHGLSQSITGRALKKGLISLHAVDIRDYTVEKHRKVDDYPFGGGAGMVMQVQPVYDCYKAVLSMIGDKHERTRVLYMSPQGRVFDQGMARELSSEESLIFLCGHYEGIDERALRLIGAQEVSLGDFVLTGGEYPAMCMIDCISRLVPGVLSEDSVRDESFNDGLLEYPQYSRPEEYMGLKVPEVLLSGHHANVDKWRRQQSILRTLDKRPDLLESASLSKKELEFLEEAMEERKNRDSGPLQ